MADNEDHREEGGNLPSCRSCRHYYITWDKHFPHGCRAMGFKSRTSPALSVCRASGIACLLFARKEGK